VETLRLLAKHLHKRGKLHLDEAFVDATFASAKKRALLLVRPSVARATVSSYVVKSVKPDNFTGALLGNSATSVREPPMALTERFNVDR
jgi:hypothetical protein